MSYAETLRSIIKSRDGRDSYGFRLNLKDDLHCQCVFEMFGGEEHVRQEYPDLYQAVRNGRCAERTDGKNEERTGLQESAYIYDLTEKDKEVRSYGSMILTDQAERLYLRMTIYQNGKEVASDFAFANGSCHKMVGCDGMVEELHDDTELSAALQACWSNKTTNELHSWVAETSIQGSPKTSISKVTMYDPVKGNSEHTPKLAVSEEKPNDQVWEAFTKPSADSGSTDVINVCYARWPAKGEVRDYVYPSRNPDNKQEVYLDVRGIIELQGKTYDHFSEANFVLDTKTKGAIFQLSQIKEHHFHAEEGGSKVYFAFPTDWKNEIEGSELPGFADCELVGEVKFYCRDSEGKVEKEPESLKFANYMNFLEKGSSRQAHVNAVKLLWGCLLKGTMIRMADGSSKKIEEIDQGEMVAGVEENGLIREVICGREESIWHVKAKGAEAEICATAEHPFYCKAGAKMACKLTGQDKLLMESGEYADIEYIYEEPGEFQIWNLLLEQGGTMYGNGYAVGDNRIQGEVMQENDIIQSSLGVRSEVKEECEKLIAEFGNW